MSMAQELSQSISQVATGAGVPTRCLITDMNQVLGRTVGNAVEMAECIDFLINPAQADPRLLDITIELAAHMLDICGAADSLDLARAKATAALNQGHAAQVFADMVTGLGGPADLLERPVHYLPQAPMVTPIKALQAGYVTAMDVRGIGLALVSLKAGRSKAEDPIDYAVGLSAMVQIGDYVEQGQPLAVAHVRNDEQLGLVNQQIPMLIQLEPEKSKVQALVKEIYQA
jgi:thymidine phosphorylase